MEVDGAGGVKLFKDDVLTHMGRVAPLPDLRITLLAGDGWSPGMIEVQSLRYTRTIPEPASVAVWLVLGCVGMAWWRRR